MIEKLKDIKPNVIIPNNSLVILLSFIFVLLITGTLLYLFFKKPKRREKPTLKEIKLKELKALDFDNDKEVAYKFTTNAYLFLDDKNKDKYEEIVKKLEPYKYKKDTPAMPKELKSSIKEFIRELL
jgi:uncharacterized membrane protein